MPVKLKYSDLALLGLKAKPKRPKATVKPSMMFERLCALHGLWEPLHEYCFAAPREWKFDWAWPEAMVALEMEGGIFGRGKPCPVCKRRPPGAHSSISGMLRDIEKYNEAVLREWRVLRCLPAEIDDGSVFQLLKRAMP